MKIIDRIKSLFKTNGEEPTEMIFPDLFSVGDSFSIDDLSKIIPLDYSLLIWENNLPAEFIITHIGDYISFDVETRNYYFRNGEHKGYLQVTYPFGYGGNPDVAIFFELISEKMSRDDLLELIGNDFESGSLLSPVLNIQSLLPMMDDDIIFSKAIADLMPVREIIDTKKASKYKMLLFDRQISNSSIEMLLIKVQKQVITLETGYLIKIKDFTF